MRRGIYVGQDKSLLGKSALIRRIRLNFLEAQFDEFGLTFDGIVLSHGWHLFPLRNFIDYDILNEPDVESDW